MKKRMLKLKEPLLVAAWHDHKAKDKNWYILPRGTLLTYSQTISSGKDVFIVYFYYDSKKNTKKVEFLLPAEIHEVDTRALEVTFNKFPLKEKNSTSLQPDEMTLEDLAEIIDGMPD